MSEYKETIVERLVTYTVNIGGEVFVIENVPARVVLETGEELFSPATVRRVEAIIRGEKKPVRVLEASVFDYA